MCHNNAKIVDIYLELNAVLYNNILCTTNSHKHLLTQIFYIVLSTHKMLNYVTANDSDNQLFIL